MGYSSSSEEESEAETATAQERSCSSKCEEEENDGSDGCPPRKQRISEEQVPKTRCVSKFWGSFL